MLCATACWYTRAENLQPVAAPPHIRGAPVALFLGRWAADASLKLAIPPWLLVRVLVVHQDLSAGRKCDERANRHDVAETRMPCWSVFGIRRKRVIRLVS